MPHAPSRLRRSGRARWRPAERPCVWLLPLALLLLVSYVYPAIDVVRYSFTNATLLNPDYEYSLQSYGNVAGNRDLPTILRVTLIFVVASVVLQLVLGLLVAMALHRGARRGLPGVTFIRIVILASWIVPGVSAGIVWQLMFNEASYGFIDGVLRLMGIPAVAWLSDPSIAIWSAVLANVWRGTAFSMILLYAGLLVIPASLYEAAAVDGATASEQFWYITLPQLRPILLINTILISIFTLNSFDLILPLDRRRTRPRHRGAVPLHLQHRLPELRPLERRRARGHPAPDQPRLHVLLRAAFAEGDLIGDSCRDACCIADIGTYLAYAVIFLFFAGPLLWLISLSIRNASEVYVSNLHIVPNQPTLENYASVMKNALLPVYLWNGLKLAVGGAFGAMLFATPAAYALSRFRFRHSKLVMIGLLAFQMISPLVIMVPLYRYMDRIGLTDSLFGAGARLHRDLRAALHLDAQGLPRRHPAEPRGRRHDRRLHALGRVPPRHPAPLPARPHLGFRAQRDPRLVTVHRSLHPDQQAGAAADRGRHLSISRALTARPRHSSSPPRAWSRSFRRWSSFFSCSA